MNEHRTISEALLLYHRARCSRAETQRVAVLGRSPPIRQRQLLRSWPSPPPLRPGRGR